MQVGVKVITEHRMVPMDLSYTQNKQKPRLGDKKHDREGSNINNKVVDVGMTTED